MLKSVLIITVLLGSFAGLVVAKPEPVAQTQAQDPALDFATDVLEIIAAAEALNKTANGSTGSP